MAKTNQTKLMIKIRLPVKHQNQQKSKKKLDTVLITGDTPVPLKQRKLPDVTAPTSEELSIFYRDLHELRSKETGDFVLTAKLCTRISASITLKYPSVLSELFDENYINTEDEELKAKCETVFDELCVTEEKAKNCELDKRTQAN